MGDSQVSGALTPYFGVNFSTATGTDNESHDVNYGFTDTNVWHTLDNGTVTLRVRAMDLAPQGYFENAGVVDQRLASYGFRGGANTRCFHFELPADTYVFDMCAGATGFSGDGEAVAYDGLADNALLFDNGSASHGDGEYLDANMSTLYSDSGWLARDVASEGISITITSRGADTGLSLYWGGVTSGASRINYVRFYT